jgi:hypothetical protein
LNVSSSFCGRVSSVNWNGGHAFTPTKEGEHPVALFKGYVGKLLIVDGGSEFNQVCAEMEFERAGCWSHLRTYFYEARQRPRVSGVDGWGEGVVPQPR